MLDLIIKLVVGASHLVAFAGILILWFEGYVVADTNVIRDNVINFFNLWTSTIFFTFTLLDNPLVPQKYRRALRTFAYIMFYYYLQSAACALDGARRLTNTNIPEGDGRRANVTGMILVLIPVILLFLATLVIENGSIRQFNMMQPVVLIIYLIAGSALLVLQFIAYSVPGICTSSPSGFTMDATSPFVLGSWLISTCFFNDNETFGLVVFLLTEYIQSFVPINPHANPDNVTWDDKAKTYKALGYIAAIVFLVITVVISKIKQGTPIFEGLGGRLISLRTLAQVVLIAVGVTGAICVWARNPEPKLNITPTLQHRTNNYVAPFAIVVPAFALVGNLLNLPTLNIVATILAVFFGTVPAHFIVATSVQGVIRVGWVLVALALWFSPVLNLALNWELKSVPEWFKGGRNNLITIVAITLIYLAGLRHNAGNAAWFAFSFIGAILFLAHQLVDQDYLRFVWYGLIISFFRYNSYFLDGWNDAVAIIFHWCVIVFCVVVSEEGEGNGFSTTAICVDNGDQTAVQKNVEAAAAEEKTA